MGLETCGLNLFFIVSKASIRNNIIKDNVVEEGLQNNSGFSLLPLKFFLLLKEDSNLIPLDDYSYSLSLSKNSNSTHQVDFISFP